MALGRPSRQWVSRRFARVDRHHVARRAISVPHQLWWRLPWARPSLEPAGLPDEVIAWRSSRATRKLNALEQGNRRRDVADAARVVAPVAADQADALAVLLRQHPPAVALDRPVLLLHPSTSVSSARPRSGSSFATNARG
jgi:hypothetical protein